MNKKKWIVVEHFKYNYLYCGDQYLRNDVTHTVTEQHSTLAKLH